MISAVTNPQTYPASGTISYPLADGDAGTAQTVALIRRLVDEGKRDEVVNRTAIEMLRRGGAFGYDKMRQGRAIYDGVLRGIGYVPDPVGKELLRPARAILEVRAGDCDEINAILLPALLESVGIEARLVTIAAHPAAPAEFTHIYCEANIDGRWVPMDAARKGARWGNTPKRAFRRRVWSLSSDEYTDVAGYPLRGLNGYGAMPTLARGAGSLTYSAPRRPYAPHGVSRPYEPQVGRPFDPPVAPTNPSVALLYSPSSPVRPRRPRRMGGLGFSWADFAKVLQEGTKSATEIIGAVKSGGNPLMPTAYQPGAAAPARQQDYTPLLLIGGAVLVGALLLRQN